MASRWDVENRAEKYLLAKEERERQESALQHAIDTAAKATGIASECLERIAELEAALRAIRTVTDRMDVHVLIDDVLPE